MFLPGKSQGQRSLGGYSPWGLKESDVTERPALSTLFFVCLFVCLFCCCCCLLDILFVCLFFAYTLTCLLFSSQLSDQTLIPCIGRQSLSYFTNRKSHSVPDSAFSSLWLVSFHQSHDFQIQAQVSGTIWFPRREETSLLEAIPLANNCTYYRT